MTWCIKCHRHLTRPSPDGYGPVCRKTFAPKANEERDLFGFNVDRACDAALERLRDFIESTALSAQMEIRHSFLKARFRHGVWTS